MQVLWIALFGGIGTALRYGVALACARLFGPALPLGTLAVNIVGSFALGVVGEALGQATVFGVPARLVLGLGLLGGFTTYSSFNLETLRMAQSGQVDRALIYGAVTLLGCLLSGLAGIALGRALSGS